MNHDAAMIEYFLVESNARLGELDQAFAELKSSPSSEDIIQGIFKVLHQVSGMSDHLGFDQLHSVSLSGEIVIEALRKGQIEYSPELSIALFSTLEFMRKQLGEIKANHKEMDLESEVVNLIGELQSLLE